jgi:hypothetical protein
MTNGMIWFCLAVGAFLILVAIATISEAISRRRVTGRVVDSIVNGSYTQEEIDRIIMRWASEDIE